MSKRTERIGRNEIAGIDLRRKETSEGEICKCCATSASAASSAACCGVVCACNVSEISMSTSFTSNTHRSCSSQNWLSSVSSKHEPWSRLLSDSSTAIRNCWFGLGVALGEEPCDERATGEEMDVEDGEEGVGAMKTSSNSPEPNASSQFYAK